MYELDKAELISNAEAKPGSFSGEMLLEREGLILGPIKK